MYRELFKLCGFEQEEIERERPRIEKAFKILDIGAEDIRRAEDRVTQYFDTQLEGIRRALGIVMRQLVDLPLVREEFKKVVYTGDPPLSRAGLAVVLASDDVYVHCPEVVVQLGLGQIFGKLNPVLEAAEENGMAPGLAMCGLNMTRLGAIAKGIAPLPDVTLTNGTYCDQSPKTDELLHEVYGVRNIFVDGCVDPNWDEFPAVSPSIIEFHAGNLRKAREELSDILGIEITGEKVREASRAYGRLWVSLIRQVWELMKSDPQPIHAASLGLFYWLFVSPERRVLQYAPDVISTLAKELKQRVDDGKGVVAKGAPRVTIPCPGAADPAISHLPEEVGLSLPVFVYSWITPREFVKSELTDPDERAVESDKKQGGYHSTTGLLYRYKEISKEWNLDGIIDMGYSCRAGSYAMLMTKKTVEGEVGIPVLTLESDLFDIRTYSPQVLRTKVETFAEMLKATKAAAAT